jgi:hypothetical protein
MLLAAPTLSTNEAAPRIIMLYGDDLLRPAFLTNWPENQRLMSAVTERTTPTARDLADRSHFEVALFWNAQRWEPFVREGRLEQLAPEIADQRGRFYPARGASPALFVFYDDAVQFTEMYRQVSRDGLHFLERAGIRVSLPD